METPNKPENIAWMWRKGNGVQGARIDERRNMILWYNEPGCACGDAELEQSLESYLTRGSRLGNLPDDINQEINAAVRWFNKA